jgi:ribonuclease R
MKRKKNQPDRLTDNLLLSLLRKERRPLSFSELAEVLSLGRKEHRGLKALVKDMERRGLIVNLRKGRIGLSGEMDLVTGTLWCSRGGNGFVIPDHAGERDLFISGRSLGPALHGDRVVARVEHRAQGKKEGAIIKVLGRRLRHVVGRVNRRGGVLFLTPTDERVLPAFVVEDTARSRALRNGDLAAGRITAFPGEGAPPACRVAATLGSLDTVASIERFITYAHSLPTRFPGVVNSEAREAAALPPGPGRTDLRGLRHVTIDGEFARDFDDAVAIERQNGGFVLSVSIADVAHFVAKGSALDSDAYGRGTSIYFPGSVTPMLPTALSNGACSLNPGEPRPAVTARLSFGGDGQLGDARFFPSLIASSARLTYHLVEEAVVKDSADAQEHCAGSLPDLRAMAELATILRDRRQQRGSLDFDLPEPEVILDIKGGLHDIVRSERLFAHAIIEEFMIAANEAVAQFLEREQVPAIFRIHEPPERVKLEGLEALLKGLSIFRGRLTASRLQSVLGDVRKTEYEFIVNRTLLRSLKQARYAAANGGHFGLASPSYLHFTSPIRRYPDLVCHRMLKAFLSGDPLPYEPDDLEVMASHLSERERMAMEAERDMEDRIRILFMRDKLGEVFDGVISNVTSYGVFVELSDVFVEGVVLFSDLADDYYHLQEEKFRVVGRRTGKSYRLGDTVRVKVAAADVEEKRLNFIFL